MQRFTKITLVLLLVVCLLVALTSLGLAQAGGQPQAVDYAIDSWTVGAGGESAGGLFSLSGTANQQSAVALTGGGFTVDGGFWTRAAETLYKLFLPVLTRGQ